MVPLFLVSMLLSPQAETCPGRPEVTGWTMVSPQSILDVMIDNYNIASLGLRAVYKNPQNPNEFVMILSRQIVLLSERPKSDGSENQGLSTLTASAETERHSKNEADALERTHKAIDPIVFIKWHTKTDEAHNQDAQDGVIEFWLLGQDGNWACKTQVEPDAILRVPITEPSLSNNNRSVTVGFKLSLGDASQVLRLDQDDLKAKETNHVK